MKKLLSIVALLAIAFSAMSQPSVRNVTAATFSGTNAASGGGGGGGSASYHNPTGSGISVISQGGLLDGQGQTLPAVALATNSAAVGGSGHELFFFNGLTLDGVSYSAIFDFGSPVKNVEMFFWQQSGQDQGVWKWQGATSTNSWSPGVNDASIWTDIGGNFTLVTAASSPFKSTNTTMSANSTSYQYYRLLGISGSTSWNPDVYQIQFKN